MYGWRGRIGLLIPATNTTMEPEFNRLAPAGVSVHSARIETDRAATLDTLIRMENDSKAAAHRVAQAEVDVVVYGCTSGSFVKGPEWNESICEEISTITGAPTVTTAGAMVASLQHTGLRKLNVVTPYVEVTNERLIAFLEHFGIEVLSLNTFDMLDQFDHAKVEPETIYQLAKRSVTKDSDGCFVACTQLRTLEVVQKLEDDLRKPVLSATQATLWQVLDIMGVHPPIHGYGSLLSELHDGKLSR